MADTTKRGCGFSPALVRTCRGEPWPPYHIQLAHPLPACCSLGPFAQWKFLPGGSACLAARGWLTFLPIVRGATWRCITLSHYMPCPDRTSHQMVATGGRGVSSSIACTTLCCCPPGLLLRISFCLSSICCCLRSFRLGDRAGSLAMASGNMSQLCFPCRRYFDLISVVCRGKSHYKPGVCGLQYLTLPGWTFVFRICCVFASRAVLLRTWHLLFDALCGEGNEGSPPLSSDTAHCRSGRPCWLLPCLVTCYAKSPGVRLSASTCDTRVLPSSSSWESLSLLSGP
jgi:hypothetical protein